MPKFTPRQRRFIEEYKVDHNATKAAMRAGYAPRHAAANSNRMLKNPDIQRAATAPLRRLCDRREQVAARVVEQAARAAFADLRRVFDDDGEVKPIAEIDAETLAGISIVHATDQYGRPVCRIRRRDKAAALKLLARHARLIQGR